MTEELLRFIRTPDDEPRTCDVCGQSTKAVLGAEKVTTRSRRQMFVCIECVLRAAKHAAAATAVCREEKPSQVEDSGYDAFMANLSGKKPPRVVKDVVDGRAIYVDHSLNKCGQCGALPCFYFIDDVLRYGCSNALGGHCCNTKAYRQPYQWNENNPKPEQSSDTPDTRKPLAIFQMAGDEFTFVIPPFARTVEVDLKNRIVLFDK